MQLLTNVQYDSRPDTVQIFEGCVDVCLTCVETEIEDSITGEVSKKFLCNIERYETHEYIDKMNKENKVLGTQINDTQLALCDVYEMLL